MSKKIFKGTINGKEFTSEVEFNKYLAEVLADNGDNLSVSKSTEIVEDEQVEEKNENPAEADEDKYIFDVSRLELKDDKTYWGMESDIESEVRKADNRDEIESTLKSLAEGMEKANDQLSDEIDDLNKKIAEIKEEIEAKRASDPCQFSEDSFI